jgi:outer membrane receptor for monomeric catechols
VVRYSKSLNDYLVTNPGDGGAAQFVQGQWWMKRGTKSRWNPTETVAAVTDLHGKKVFGGLEHSFDVGIELSREENLNATYAPFATSASACPTGFTIAAATLTSVGGGDCTLVYHPNANDPWAARSTVARPREPGQDGRDLRFRHHQVRRQDPAEPGPAPRQLFEPGLRPDGTTSANGVFTTT